MSLLSPPAPGTLDFDSELAGQSPPIQEAARKLRDLLGGYGVEGDLPLRPASLSYRAPEDRVNLKAWAGLIHALPPAEQQKMPSLLRLLGRGAWALGEFQAAQRDFHNLGEALQDPAAKGDAFHHAYLAALERPHLPDAIYELKFALAAAGDRVSPVPLAKFEPEKILSADGFGLLARCRLTGTRDMVCVRTLDAIDLDSTPDELLAAYQRQRTVSHPAVLKIGSAALQDAAPHSLVLMVEYLEGSPLDGYVQRHGSLSVRDAQLIGKQMAEGLAAAHAAGLAHRAVRPANVNVQKLKEGGFRVILGDFGVMPRPDLLRQAQGQTAQLVRTRAGRTLVSALEFAAPEQLGRAAGPSGPASDLYSLGRTLCFALFDTPQPTVRHWQSLPEGLASLLNDCLKEEPAERPSAEEVVRRFEALLPPPAAPAAVPTPATSADAKPPALVTHTAPPPGVAQAFEPKRGAGAPSRRRLTPVEQLRLRLQRLTILYFLIALGVGLVLCLAYVIFFYRPAREPQVMAPVLGRVMLLDQPVADAKITFYPDDREGVIARGATNEKGEFILTSLLPKDGAYAGTYRVTIEKDQGKIRLSPTLPGGDPRNPNQVRFNPLYQIPEVHPLYSSPTQTPLVIVVPKEGFTDLEIRLSLQPSPRR